MQKQCTICDIIKPLEDFYNKKAGKLGKDSACKECRARQNKKQYIKNREKIKECSIDYYHKNKEKRKEYAKKKYEKKKEYREKNKKTEVKVQTPIKPKVSFKDKIKGIFKFKFNKEEPIKGEVKKKGYNRQPKSKVELTEEQKANNERIKTEAKDRRYPICLNNRELNRCKELVAKDTGVKHASDSEIIKYLIRKEIINLEKDEQLGLL